MPNHVVISPSACARELTGSGLAVASPELSVDDTRLVTDTRDFRSGDIFLAYQGVSFDSHDSLEQIATRQPALIIHERPVTLPEVPCIRVSNARAAWAQLASAAYGHPHKQLTLIGVTGTNGKTSTVHFIRQLLGQKVAASLGTLGAYIGDEHYPTAHTTPDPPALYNFLRAVVDAGKKYVAMEVSSHAMAQHKLFPLSFALGIFTSFSRDHLDLHGTLENYWAAKCAFLTDLTRHNAHVILCSKIANVRNLAKQLAADGKQVHLYGPAGSSPQPDFGLNRVIYDKQQATMEIIAGSMTSQVKTQLAGTFAFENLLAALLAQKYLLELTDFPIDAAAILPPPGRLELVKGSADAPRVFVDYAHTPDAITTALAALRPATTGQLWIVFGCGGERDAGKRPLMAKAAEAGADRVILTNDNPRREDPQRIIDDTLAGFAKKTIIECQRDRREAIRLAIAEADRDDTVLIAGKGHETYMEINGVRHDFDDRIEAAAALKLRRD